MKRRVLVVDDEPAVVELIAATLMASGYDVIRASNAEEASRAIRNGAVDLLITDILMPEKDGLELLIELKREQRRLRTIVISGAPSKWRLLETVGEIGALKFLAKPFSCQELLDAVEGTLAKL